jgi:hypothetical protein
MSSNVFCKRIGKEKEEDRFFQKNVTLLKEEKKNFKKIFLKILWQP